MIGEGRLAVAEKLFPQLVELSPFVKVAPQALIEPGEEAKLVGIVLKVTTGSWNVTETVTALLGIVNWHGLPVEPPEQEAPDVVQLENCQLAEEVAITEIEEPTASEHSLGQFGETEPEPEATFVVKLCPVVVDETDVVAVSVIVPDTSTPFT